MSFQRIVTAVSGLIALGNAYDVVDGIAYFTGDEALNYADAVNACSSRGGALIAVNNDNKAAIQATLVEDSWIASYNQIVSDPPNDCVIFQYQALGGSDAGYEGCDQTHGFLCAGVTLEPTQSPTATPDPKSKFQYGPSSPNCASMNEPCAPQYWGTVAGYESCNGIHQSPVDFGDFSIAKHTLKNHDRPRFEVAEKGCKDWTQLTSDHAFEMNFEESGCHNLRVVYRSTEYELDHIHFHSPSEHTWDGGRHLDAEVHLVHKSHNGELLVMAVLLRINENRPDNELEILKGVWDGTDHIEGAVHRDKALNPYRFFIRDDEYVDFYKYDGSLTVPPCTEGVKWFVSEYTRDLSLQDLTNIRNAVHAHPMTVATPSGNNNRPTQPVNDRKIYYADSTDETYPMKPPPSRRLRG